MQGRGEESQASWFQGSPAGCGCGERLGGHRRVVLGRRWPHGTGGGEWFPGTWKAQGGETGAEPAAGGAPHGAAGRVTAGCPPPGGRVAFCRKSYNLMCTPSDPPIGCSVRILKK